jgi:beta-lactamase class C
MSGAFPVHSASRRTVLAGGIAAFACAPSLASAKVRHDNLARRVDRTILPLIAEFRIPGMVVGVTEAGNRRCFAYGVASLESRHPVDALTRFEIGSVSKVFTCLLAAIAVVEGKLRWTDPASLHLPQLKGRPLGDVTIEQLATYTAGGLPLQFPGAVDSWDRAWEFYEGWVPPSAPGRVRLYSNPSIGLLGAAVAAAFGGDFAALMEEHVFAPLRLSHSFMRWPDQERRNFAWGYDSTDHPVRAAIAPASAEAYGVKTSADDLLALLDGLIDPQRVSGNTLRAALRETMQPRFMSAAFAQCLGWERYTMPVALPQVLEGNGPDMIMQPQPVAALPDLPPADHRQGSFFNKTGSTNGFGAYAAFMPERRLGIVILANRNFPNSARVETAQAILDFAAGGA